MDTKARPGLGCSWGTLPTLFTRPTSAATLRGQPRQSGNLGCPCLCLCHFTPVASGPRPTLFLDTPMQCARPHNQPQRWRLSQPPLRYPLCCHRVHPRRTRCGEELVAGCSATANSAPIAPGPRSRRRAPRRDKRTPTRKRSSEASATCSLVLWYTSTRTESPLSKRRCIQEGGAR